MSSLKDKRVAFRSLTENLDATTASGEFLFQVFGALAPYERALIQERVVAGLAAARKRGRIGGRPQAITGEKVDAIIAALDGAMSKTAVCRNFGVKRTTWIATLARVGWPAATRKRGGVMNGNAEDQQVLVGQAGPAVKDALHSLTETAFATRGARGWS